MIRILREDIAAVKRQYSYIPEEAFDEIIRIDPTFNEARDSVGKYGKWLLGLFKKTSESGEKYSDILASNEGKSMLRDLLAEFDAVIKDRTKTIEKDIMRFKTHEQLEAALDNTGEAELTGRQKSRMAKQGKDYTLVYEDDDFFVFVPLNQKGDLQLAQYGGSEKAHWCTAADNAGGQHQYDYYLAKGGCYYVLINKKNYNKKYQFHFESDQFMDEDNSPVRPNSICSDELMAFFKQDEPVRAKRALQQIRDGIIRLFNLPEDTTSTELQASREFAIPNGALKWVAAEMDGQLSGAGWYVNDGSIDFDYDPYWVDNSVACNDFNFTVPESYRSSLEDALLELGMTDEMLEDFYHSPSKFIDELEDGYYDEVCDDPEYISQTLQEALVYADRDARMCKYEDEATAAIDKTLEEYGIVFNYYRIRVLQASYEQIYREVAQGTKTDFYGIDDIIKEYLSLLPDHEGALKIDVPYYGFDDYPDEEVLCDILCDAIYNVG